MSRQTIPSTPKTVVARPLSIQSMSIQARPYLGELLGGAGQPGTRLTQAQGSQDALWPPAEPDELARQALDRVTRATRLAAGRVYVVADGVSFCADGAVAAHLAVQTIHDVYYRSYASSDPRLADRAADREHWLRQAVWTAHTTLAHWNEKYYCWRAELHPDGRPRTYTRAELPNQVASPNRSPLCPICGQWLAGLQAAALAAVVWGAELTLVGVGDVAALHVPASGALASRLTELESKDQYLGGTQFASPAALPARQLTLAPGDWLALCTDGAWHVLEARYGEPGWLAAVTRELSRVDLARAVSELVGNLHDYRRDRSGAGLDDDLTVLAVGRPDAAALGQARQVLEAASELPLLERLQRQEQVLLHEPDAGLWQQYQAGLAELNRPLSPPATPVALPVPADSPLIGRPVSSRRGTPPASQPGRSTVAVPPPASAKTDSAPLKTDLYLGESAGGYGRPGSRHEGPTQDALGPVWDSHQRPAPSQFLAAGRLYVVADGVSRCSDGHLASQTAVQAIHAAYYAEPAPFDAGPDVRLARLRQALWAAHEQLARDDRYHCWRDIHPARQPRTYRRADLPAGLPLCPHCRQPMAGLQSTALAAVVWGQQVSLVGAGDSVALYLPAGSSAVDRFADLETRDLFLGSPELDRESQLLARSWTLAPGDRLVLASDGLLPTVQARHAGTNWQEYLRSGLSGSALDQSARWLIEDLDRFRQSHRAQESLQDDLSLLVIGLPDEPALSDTRRALAAAAGRPLLERLRLMERLLLHDPDAALWQQYQAGLAELSQSPAHPRAATQTVILPGGPTRLLAEQPERLVLAPYLGEWVAGYAIAGARGADETTNSQDSIWPAAPEPDGAPAKEVEALLTQPALGHTDMLLSGRVYGLADGVSNSAEGRLASRLALNALGQAYYRQLGRRSDSNPVRLQRLREAAWQAHQQLQTWDGPWVCWETSRHASGQPVFQPRNQASKTNGYLACPECGDELAGLQTTLVTASLRGRRLALLAIGNSAAYRLPAGPGAVLEPLYAPPEQQFAGMGSLREDMLLAIERDLESGDWLLLASDGLVNVLVAHQAATGQHPDTYLRDKLQGRQGTELHPAVQSVVEELHAFRQSRPDNGLDDDLSLVVVAIPPAEVIESERQALDDAIRALPRSGASAAECQQVVRLAEQALLYADDDKLWDSYALTLRRWGRALWHERGQPDDEIIQIFRAAASVDEFFRPWWEAALQAQSLILQSQAAELKPDHDRRARAGRQTADLRGSPLARLTALRQAQAIEAGLAQAVAALAAIDLPGLAPGGVPTLQQAFGQVLAQVEQAGPPETTWDEIHARHVPLWLVSVEVLAGHLQQVNQSVARGELRQAWGWLAWLPASAPEISRWRAEILYRELLALLGRPAAGARRWRHGVRPGPGCRPGG